MFLHHGHHGYQTKISADSTASFADPRLAGLNRQLRQLTNSATIQIKND